MLKKLSLPPLTRLKTIPKMGVQRNSRLNQPDPSFSSKVVFLFLLIALLLQGKPEIRRKWDRERKKCSHLDAVFFAAVYSKSQSHSPFLYLSRKGKKNQVNLPTKPGENGKIGHLQRENSSWSELGCKYWNFQVLFLAIHSSFDHFVPPRFQFRTQSYSLFYVLA